MSKPGWLVINPMLQVNVTGYLDVQQRLELLMLPTVKRRRLLGQVGLRVRTMARTNLRQQRNIDGSGWAPRKKKGPRMLRKLLSECDHAGLFEELICRHSRRAR